MTHELKCVSPYFEAVKNGSKTFEIRYNDRDFKVGDIIVLRKFNITHHCYIGDESEAIRAAITYITDFEQKQGWVVLGIKKESK